MTGMDQQINHTGSRQEAGSACLICRKPKLNPEKGPVRIRAAIFFDGTLNNRTNTEQGEKGIIKGESYKNALTNIAILQSYHQGVLNYDHNFSVYVEGIGTEDERPDSINGMALGQGDTGILAKVEIGITKITAHIKKIIKKGQEISCLHLDCFGFSRGAAAARNFIHTGIYGNGDTFHHRLQSSGYSVSEIRAKFVGLYDTVASHGVFAGNDTEDLHLDAIKYAEDVVQLAAAEEHRKHFPLTNINSASHGLQLFLPGAHSDIGGGYLDSLDEIDHQIMFLCPGHGQARLSAAQKAALVRDREWLLESGWYVEGE